MTEPTRLASLSVLEILRRIAVVASALSIVAAATMFRVALFDDEVQWSAIFVFVIATALFLRTYHVGTQPLALPKRADIWDVCVAWLEQHGAIPALVALTATAGVMYAGVFLGETIGDDLTFHMAESVRLADCIRAGDWDFWNPSANAGYASAYYYQVIPQLMSAVPAALFDHHLFWFQLSLWLPQVGTPVAAYRGMRMMGATPWQSVIAAFAVTFISGASRWGTGADGTFQVGLYTQTWALAAFPLGLGYGVHYLTEGKSLPAAVAWGAFVFLCHPFASIALCMGLAFGVLAHYLQYPIRNTALRISLAALIGVALLGNLAMLLFDPQLPAKPSDLVDAAWAPKYIYIAPLIVFAGLLARVLASRKRLTAILLAGIAIAFLANAIGFAAITAVPKRPEGATEDLPAVWSLGAASLYIGPLLLLAAIAGRLALTLRARPDPDDEPPPLAVSQLVRLVVLGGCLLVATLPGWLTVIVDRDGFGGFPHRVGDEVGPGYQELMRWYTKGTLLDNNRLVLMTWTLPLVVLFGRMKFARWLWTPALVFAALLALGPHAPKTADDLLPAVRFLGAMQVVLALGIGAGVYSIGAALWNLGPTSLVFRAVHAVFKTRPDPEISYGIRTAVIAIACGLVIFTGLTGSRVLSARVNVLTNTETFDYRGEIMEMNAIIAKQPQGKKQVGPGCESHWWNLLSYVYEKRPSLLQMGGGGLQASPNYDFLWSVRDFPKLAWVYDTPLFEFARSSASTAPEGEVLGQTRRYELRRLPAPGLVSPVQVTGTLPAGESRAGSPVRVAAIEWLKSQAPMDDQFLAYDGNGSAGPPPAAKVIRAFAVDPSPGDTADIYADVEVEQATTFVARESWHPRWHAYVDGVEVPIRRVTPDFPAIDVAPGKHTLAFRFERPWWAQASWLMWPGVSIGAWLVLRRRRRRRAVLPEARVV
ncbi:MAG: hypothetical protein ABI867_10515 [Kofleriaceae bacterium]